MKYYSYRHIVGFEETNLVSNVYFVNYLRWQGKCREMFLRDHAPDVLQDLKHGLALFTVSCSCDYLAEITAFDELDIQMSLKLAGQNQIAMGFEYWRVTDTGRELIARGKQHIACMRRQDGKNVPTPIPTSLHAALERYK